MDKFQKALFTSIFGLLFLLSGCTGSDSDNTDQNNNGNNQINSTKVMFSVSRSINRLNIDTNKLQAFLTIDDQPRQAMTLSESGDQFEVTINVTTGSHDFRIEFELSEDDFGNKSIPLVAATKNMQIGTGSNHLAYEESEYVDVDSDEDGFSNVKEVDAKSDPFNKDSKPDVTSATVAISPANLSRIGGAQSLTLTFSESMNPSSLAIEGDLNDFSDGGVWSTTSKNNDTLTFTPSTSWEEGVLQASVNVDDTAGVPIDPLNLSYVVDLTSPAGSPTPVNDSVISPSQTIVIVFEESINEGDFALSGSLAEYTDGGNWSTSTVINDTLTINPTDQWPAGQQTLTVNGSDLVGNPIAALDLSYTVDASSATSNVAPQSGSVINDSQAIVVNFSKNMDTSSLILGGSLAQQSNGGAWSSNKLDNDTLTISPESTWSAGPKILTIDVTDTVGNPVASLELAYTVDSTAPTAIANPASDGLINGSQKIVVTFSESIDKNSLALNGTMASLSNGGTWNSIGAQNTTLTISPTSSWSSGNQTLGVSAKDIVGNSMDTLKLNYSVDVTKPKALITPASNATINGKQAIVVKFSESMLTSSLQLSGLMATQSNGGTWSSTKDTLTISPASSWKSGSQSLTVSATDLVGNQADTINAVYTVDALSPNAQISPPSGANILDDQIIKIVFSESMDTNTTAISGSLASAAKPGAWSKTNVNNDTLTLSPSSAWPDGNQNISITVKDLVGNPAVIALTYEIQSQYNPNDYQLSGRLNFNGSSITNRTTETPTLWARDESTGKAIDGESIKYYPQTGYYGINGLPNGKVGLSLYIHVTGALASLPGNFDTFHTVDLSALTREEAIAHDIELAEVLHLLKPYDNNQITLTTDDYPPHSSPVYFSWEPIQGAVRYQVTISRYSHSPSYEFIENMFSSNITSGANAVTVTLPKSAVNEHYQFNIYAYNSSGVRIGIYHTVYKNGLGWDYRFIVN